MSKASRDKGKRGERAAVKLLREVYPDARRSANQSGGAVQPDVDGTPYWVECKTGRSIGLWAALQQAIDDRAAAGDGRPILLYLKRDRTAPIVVMLASEWIEECCKR
jgi:hypothetical protein